MLDITTILDVIISILLGFLVTAVYFSLLPRSERQPEPQRQPDIEIWGTEAHKRNYYQMQEEQMVRHGMRAKERLKRGCEYRKEERNGLTFQFWKNQFGVDVVMERSDGDGYVQLCDEFGEVFGVVVLRGADGKPSAASCVNSNKYSQAMRWFMENH